LNPRNPPEYGPDTVRYVTSKSSANQAGDIVGLRSSQDIGWEDRLLKMIFAK